MIPGCNCRRKVGLSLDNSLTAIKTIGEVPNNFLRVMQWVPLISVQSTLLGGARFESYNMIYHAQYTQVIHTVYGDAASTESGAVTVSDSASVYYTQTYHSKKVPYSAFNVNRTDNNVFPDVQLQYKVNDWSDLRLAYTTGISRPDYTAIIPKVAFL